MSEANERHIVLVVDDSPDTLTMLTDTLERSGAKVLVAISGQDALDLVGQITPDLILLDAVMPRLDGFETCRRLKAMPELANTPIIFMTGLSETAHIVRGLEVGGVDYVTKPLVLDELLARIQVHLANARVTRSTRAALDTVGRHLLATDRSGVILWTTSQARVLLELGDSPAPAVPSALHDALQRLLATSGTDSPIAITTPGGQHVDLAYLGEVSQGETLFRLRVDDSVGQAKILRQSFPLTSREAEVLIWITRGKSNRDIGEILGLSPRTVNKHLEQIFVKLGVENRASATAAALGAIS